MPNIVRETPRTEQIPRPTSPPTPCEDCRAITAFQTWQDVPLPPGWNIAVEFAKVVPQGKRGVIELVTASISVPAGEWASLRMYTTLGGGPTSQIDLFLTFQGNSFGQSNYVVTHSLRAYTDNAIAFNINRDNGTTSGSAFICLSGYIVG
jgi:hypothetical protein